MRKNNYPTDDSSINMVKALTENTKAPDWAIEQALRQGWKVISIADTNVNAKLLVRERHLLQINESEFKIFELQRSNCADYICTVPLADQIAFDAFVSKHQKANAETPKYPDLTTINAMPKEERERLKKEIATEIFRQTGNIWKVQEAIGTRTILASFNHITTTDEEVNAAIKLLQNNIHLGFSSSDSPLVRVTNPVP